MGTENAILEAMYDNLSTPELFSPAVPVSWPDKKFTVPTPSTAARWLRVSFLPGTTMGLSVDTGESGFSRHVGLMQVDVLALKGVGLLPRTLMADAIVNRFSRGTRLDRDGCRVLLDAPYVLPLQPDDPWAFLPVRVPYVCYAE